MKRTPLLLIGMLMSMLLFSPSCKDGTGFNLFTLEDDIALGKQLEAEIASNPVEYPVLNPTTYSNVYTYLNEMRDKILASGQVKYTDEFEWKLYVINDDNTLNAFCAPGGYIYIYTGIIKYLDSEDQLAGVLGHEMAHADRRHSTGQLTKQYGISVLLDVIGGNSSQLGQIAGSLVSLKFSREDEEEADEYSVIYLCPTEWNAAGAAGFFQKIEDEGGSNPPQFLSTHPNPDNRIEKINSKQSELNCTGTETNISSYVDLKNSLP